MKKIFTTVLFALGLLCAPAYFCWMAKVCAAPDPDASDPRATPRAHVRLNDEAAALLAQAANSAESANWVQTAMLYQKVLEQYGEYVVPVIDGETVYKGARYAALEGLRDMPPAGRKTYRQMFDLQAKALFETWLGKSEIINQKSEIIDRYLFSTYGEKALVILSSYCLERADIGKAERYLNQALWLYGNGPYPEPLRVNIDLLAKLKTASAVNAGAQARSFDNNWTSYCGNSTRNRSALGILPSGALPPPIGTFPGNNDPNRLIPPVPAPNPSIYNPYYRTPVYNIATYLPYFPVLVGNMIFLSDGSVVYAFDISKQPSPAMLGQSTRPISPAGDNAPASRIPALATAWRFEIPRPQDVQAVLEERVICTVTVGDNKLYAPLITSYEEPETQLWGLPVKYPFPNRTMFCFDAVTGKAVWDSRQLVKVSFSVAPAAENGMLYVGGIKVPKQTDLPEHHVYCLDAATGAVIWETFIASGMLETNLFNNSSREPVGSPVTIDGETLYYCANIGVVAALNKYDGAIKWVSYYEQRNIPPVRQDYTPTHLSLDWINNPVIAGNGSVYAAPLDSSYLICLSAQDGRASWRWNDEEIGRTRYIIGAKGNQLVVSGSAAAACLSLDKQGKRDWVITSQPFRGRGLIADDRVYIPTFNGVLEVSLKSGKIINTAQWSNPFQECGNLVLTPGLILSATHGKLNVFKLPPAGTK
ncbi:MAG: PQQ-binding-like beta-propeller repeat protein [Planctomycetota bacterium]